MARKKTFATILIFFAALALLYHANPLKKYFTSGGAARACFNDRCYDVEVADTAEKRA